MSERRAVRVAFVQAGLSLGGAERLVQALAEKMSRDLVEPRIVNLYGPGAIGERMQAAGWAMTNHLANGRFDLAVAGRLARALERERADVAYVYDSPLPMFWMGQQRRRHDRPRLVLGFHSTGRLGDPIQHFLARRSAIPAADRLVALTESHRRSLSAELRVPEARFRVVGSGVDLTRFDATMPRAAARRAAGLPEAGPLVGIVAALRPEKNYRALDVAVLSSHPIVETLPVTLLEAAACGTPAIATAVGSVTDVVAEGETGYVVAPGDEAALAARIVALLHDPDLRTRIGAAARRRAEERFNERDMIRCYESLFVEAAGAAA